MSFIVHGDGNGKINCIKYSPDLPQIGASIFVHLLQVLLLPILFFLSLVFVLQRYPEAVKTDLALSSSLTLLGLVVLTLVIVSILRAARCIRWFRDKSQFVFEKYRLITEDKFGRQTEYYWSDLKRITPQSKHLIFNSGRRVIIPAEFWNVHYNNRQFKSMLGDSLFSNVRTPRSPIKKTQRETESSTKQKDRTCFTVHYDSDGKICSVEYLPNSIRMVSFACRWMVGACLLTLIFIGPLINWFLDLIRGTQNPLPSGIVPLSGIMGIFFLVLTISFITTYSFLFWLRPHYIFEKEGLKYVDRKGNTKQYLWKDLSRITLIDSHFVFKSGRRVFFSEEFWRVYYNREDFTELLGDKLLSKSGINICGKMIRIPMWYGP